MEERRGRGRDGGGRKVRDSVTFQLRYCVGAQQYYISIAIDRYQRKRDVGSAGFFQSRQILVCTLPVNCSCPEEKWTLASTAFILDRGQFPSALVIH